MSAAPDQETDAATTAMIDWMRAQLKAGRDPGVLACVVIGLGVDALCSVTGQERAVELVREILDDLPPVVSH